MARSSCMQWPARPACSGPLGARSRVMARSSVCNGLLVCMLWPARPCAMARSSVCNGPLVRVYWPAHLVQWPAYSLAVACSCDVHPSSCAYVLVCAIRAETQQCVGESFRAYVHLLMSFVFDASGILCTNILSATIQCSTFLLPHTVYPKPGTVTRCSESHE
jgi:hypothetical protein